MAMQHGGRCAAFSDARAIRTYITRASACSFFSKGLWYIVWPLYHALPSCSQPAFARLADDAQYADGAEVRMPQVVRGALPHLDAMRLQIPIFRLEPEDLRSSELPLPAQLPPPADATGAAAASGAAAAAALPPPVVDLEVNYLLHAVDVRMPSPLPEFVFPWVRSASLVHNTQQEVHQLGSTVGVADLRARDLYGCDGCSASHGGSPRTVVALAPHACPRSPI